MLSWIAENYAALIVYIVLALVIGGALFAVIRNKKKGKSSCGCNCAGCVYAGSCHSYKTDDKNKEK